MCSKWSDEADLRIAELKHCYVTLNRDQFFPGYSFVFTKGHVTELFHLDRELRGAVMEEVTVVAAALYTLFQPAKINYELLGNMVPHMHWHVVPRFTAHLGRAPRRGDPGTGRVRGADRANQGKSKALATENTESALCGKERFFYERLSRRTHVHCRRSAQCPGAGG